MQLNQSNQIQFRASATKEDSTQQHPETSISRPSTAPPDRSFQLNRSVGSSSRPSAISSSSSSLLSPGRSKSPLVRVASSGTLPSAKTADASSPPVPIPSTAAISASILSRLVHSSSSPTLFSLLPKPSFSTATATSASISSSSSFLSSASTLSPRLMASASSVALRSPSISRPSTAKSSRPHSASFSGARSHSPASSSSASSPSTSDPRSSQDGTNSSSPSRPVQKLLRRLADTHRKVAVRPDASIAFPKLQFDSQRVYLPSSSASVLQEIKYKSFSFFFLVLVHSFFLCLFVSLFLLSFLYGLNVGLL